MVKKKTCVFISGNGSNLKNLILKSRDYNFPIIIKLIVSNKKHAFGINYAKKNVKKIKKYFTKKFIPYEIGFISKEKKNINIFSMLQRKR